MNVYKLRSFGEGELIVLRDYLRSHVDQDEEDQDLTEIELELERRGIELYLEISAD